MDQQSNQENVRTRSPEPDETKDDTQPKQEEQIGNKFTMDKLDDLFAALIKDERGAAAGSPASTGDGGDGSWHGITLNIPSGAQGNIKRKKKKS